MRGRRVFDYFATFFATPPPSPPSSRTRILSYNHVCARPAFLDQFRLSHIRSIPMLLHMHPRIFFPTTYHTGLLLSEHLSQLFSLFSLAGGFPTAEVCWGSSFIRSPKKRRSLSMYVQGEGVGSASPDFLSLALSHMYGDVIPADFT